MRLIKTFILRLYSDNEQPKWICGALQALPAPKTYSFKNDVELLHLLQCLVNPAAEDISLNLSEDENQADLSGPDQPNH